MHSENEFLATVPFDIYQLTLFQLVAKHRNFSAAANEVRLTQSAVTRQIQAMEAKLGVELFERTTRRVRLTLPGARLLERASKILPLIDEAIREVGAASGNTLQRLSVGVCRTIGLAYYPGFFFAFRRSHPLVQLRVEQDDSQTLISRVSDGELDAALVPCKKASGGTIRYVHRFKDEFILIAAPNVDHPDPGSITDLKTWLLKQNWLMPRATGWQEEAIHDWLHSRGFFKNAAMEFDSFDVIVNLVSLGLGVSLVPRRVLPLYEGRRKVTRIPLANGFSRELAVAVRRRPIAGGLVSQFTESVLF